MGIKFLCDACQRKIHVKAFLAGKRGICPHCGAKVRIPSQQEPALGATIDDDQQGEMPMAEAIDDAVESPDASRPAMATVEPHAATALPLSAPQTNALQANVPPANVPAQPIPTAIVEPLAARPVDPIDEAPAAVWYVRPSGGGQYGPAPGTIMRQWIAEGRIGAESLVWREDWPEWKPACDVFPPPDAPRTVQIEPASAAIATAAPAISSHSDAAPTPAATPNPISRRSRSNSAALFWTVGLSIMVLVLLVVLVVVLSTQT